MIRKIINLFGFGAANNRSSRQTNLEIMNQRQEPNQNIVESNQAEQGQTGRDNLRAPARQRDDNEPHRQPSIADDHAEQQINAVVPPKRIDTRMHHQTKVEPQRTKVEPQRTISSNDNWLFRLRKVTKGYVDGRGWNVILDGINLNIRAGALTSIVGPSGCGKSTLMHILGASDKPDNGSVLYDGDFDVGNASRKQAESFRMYQVAFVYQTQNMLSYFNILHNVMDPLMMCGVPRNTSRQISLKILESVGLLDKWHRKIYELSGGECQRAAIARAVASGANAILADEPTGSLDNKTGDGIMALLRKISTDMGISIVLITHEEKLAVRYSDFIIDLQYVKRHPKPQDFSGFTPRQFLLYKQTKATKTRTQ